MTLSEYSKIRSSIAAFEAESGRSQNELDVLAAISDNGNASIDTLLDAPIVRTHSMSTIYRTVTALVSAGAIRKVSWGVYEVAA